MIESRERHEDRESREDRECGEGSEDRESREGRECSEGREDRESSESHDPLWREDFDRGRFQVKSLPLSLHVACTVGCNLRCRGCVHASGRIQKQGIKPSAFTGILEVLPYVKNLTFTGSEVFYKPGDPYGYVEQIFDFAKKNPGLNLSAVTNGTLMGRENAELVLDHFSWCQVSLDALSDEKYSQIRRGGNFTKVIENLKRIAQMKKARGLSRREAPLIGVSFILSDLCYREVSKTVDLAKDLGLSSITIVKPWSGTLQEIDILSSAEKVELFLEEKRKALKMLAQEDIDFVDRTSNFIAKEYPHLLSEEEKRALPSAKKVSAYPKCCTLPFTDLWINVSGLAYCCCTSPTIIGNVNRSKIPSLWNSRAIQSMRERIYRGDYSRDCFSNCVKGYALPNYNDRHLLFRIRRKLRSTFGI